MDDLRTRGSALNARGKHTEALSIFDRATQLASDSFVAWGNKGNALNGLKRYSEALVAIDKALALASNAIGWCNRAIALRGLGRIAEAEEAELYVKQLQQTAGR
jgi:tetratricopeptide (TPR) repeat protein